MSPKHCYLRTSPRLRGVRLTSHDDAPDGSLMPEQILRAYGFVQNQFAGSPPVTIGVLSLGGGVVALDMDLACAAWGMPEPLLVVEGVGGATNDPTADSGANEENSLDILILSYVWWYLTGQPATIRLVIGPNASDGMTLALDALGSLPGVSTISCSWGGPASSWDSSERDAFAAKLSSLVAGGVTFLAASGDSSEDDGETGPTVDYPCADPNAWAVGGTSLVLAPDGTIARESAWGDGLPGDDGSGGGFDMSVVLPSWQDGVVPGKARGAPDSAACADPETGWRVFANGSPVVMGGTSAATPFLAALVAVAKARGGVPGLVSPRMYAQRSTAFADVIVGSNGYPAVPGWDPATGLGSPRGAWFIQAVGAQPTIPVVAVLPPIVDLVPGPGSPATLPNVLAWVRAALDAGPAVTMRSQAEALVEAALTRNWPRAAPHAPVPVLYDARRIGRPELAPVPMPPVVAVTVAPAPMQPHPGVSSGGGPANAPDLVLVGYVGAGLAIRGVGGQGVEVVPAPDGDPVPGEGVRLIGWNRPGGTATDLVREKGTIRAIGAPTSG